MPKIRGIKPEFWTDDAVVELSIPARLLFIGLWNFACDNGHLDDKPKQLKMRILPADDVDVDELLSELGAAGRIRRQGGTITIPKFASHQRPHRRWWTVCDLASCVPPDGNNGGTTVAPQGHNRGTTEHRGRSTVTDVDVTDGEGDVDARGREAAASPAAAKRPRAPGRIPHDWTPTPEHHAYATTHAIDLDRQAFRFRNHATTTARTVNDWNAAFTLWLDTERDRTPPPQPAGDIDPWAHLPDASAPRYDGDDPA